jgi:hypothetical protein
MNKVKVIQVERESLTFDNGIILASDHEQCCCENHYLSFKGLTLSDFKGLEFDITTDDFFERIDEYGIALKPLNGHPVRIPGYGSNNGYYSSNLELILYNNNGFKKVFDISACQKIEWN